MADSRWLIAIVLVGLILAGCMVAPTVRGPDMPSDWILEDVAPVETFTAPARTARPSPNTPTPTGTLAPTPTVVGIWIYEVSDMAGGCDTTILTPTIPTVAPIGTRYLTDDTGDVGIFAYVCNMNNVAVDVSWYTAAESQVLAAAGNKADAENYCETTGSNECDPAWTGWSSTVLYDIFPCPPGANGAHERQEERRTVTLYPHVEAGGILTNTYAFDLDAVSTLSDTACGNSFGVVEWDIQTINTFDPNDGDPTPTRDATRNAWITEVLAKPQGVTCGDWNLRGGCGWNDQFVEVGVPSAMSLAGYRIDIEDAANAVTCSYTIASDNLTEPLKTFWQDYMDSGVTAPTATPTGTITPTTTPTATPTGTLTPVPTVTPAPDNCGPWPVTGYAKLYNANGALIDTRAYDYSGGGQYGDSWAATDWTNPGGQWWWYSPSPGMANRTPPTATPTP